jgi:hypothetical protein
LIIVSDWQYRLVRVSSLPNTDIAAGHFRHCKASTQATVILGTIRNIIQPFKNGPVYCHLQHFVSNIPTTILKGKIKH